MQPLTQTRALLTRANANAERLSLPDAVFLPTMGKWMLRRPFTYVTDGRVAIAIRTGFLFDGASTPALSWLIGFQPWAFGEAAPLVHDALYRVGGKGIASIVTIMDAEGNDRKLTRKEADQIFREAALREGVSERKASIGYWALRAFGRWAWNG